jgi:signal transduction histidine kinase
LATIIDERLVSAARAEPLMTRKPRRPSPDPVQREPVSSRSGEPHVELEINRLLEAFAADLRRLCGERHAVDLKLASTNLGVSLDPKAFKQVMVALVSNAIEAMPNGGLVSIETMRRPMSEAAGNDCAAISVIDTGIGMAGSIVARAHFAHFTTKADRPGMGLSMVAAFARELGGTVAIKSEVHVGTAVSLLLPMRTVH